MSGKLWSVEFYPGVAKQLLLLPASVQARLIRLFELVQVHGSNLGAPHSKALGSGLFEIRAKAKEGIGRALFCNLDKQGILVLHIFLKKSQKIPSKEFELARKRYAEVQKSWS